MTKGEEKFGKVFTHRVIITPKNIKELSALDGRLHRREIL